MGDIILMTQEDVEKKIYSYARDNKIIFECDDMVPEISIYIINYKNTEAKQKDLLKLVKILFSRIRNGRGTLVYDERNGKLVCEKIRCEIKKYMAFYFETQLKGFLKQYKIYKFIVDNRYL